ncbi:MAG: Cache 3/Cache 2 fusion domain-containing protein [Anaerolineales bacterium]|nr:Cache 3/Cache 2 fusion domain-containing protein [Anaerolineales bacterium]
MKRFSDWSIRTQWTLMGTVGVVLIVLALVSTSLWGITELSKKSVAAVAEVAAGDLDHIAQGVVRLIEAQDQALRHEVANNGRVALRELDRSGGLSLGTSSTTWTATEQFTKASTEVRLPQLRLGGSATALDAYVQEIAATTDSAVTVFQRMNAAGDMLRVATTVQTAEGKPAVGTYIPATMADGTPNGVLASVLAGQSYSGVAYVVDAWYVADYEPLLDAQGEVMGMMFVGVPRDEASTLRDALYATQVGQTGYVYVLGSSGADKGAYIISKLGERDGENIWETLDADGQPVIQNIINTATDLKSGELGTVRYRWQNPGDPEPRWKITRIAYYAPYNWVIGVGAYEDEYLSVEQELQAAQQQLLLVLAGIGVAFAVLVAIGMQFIVAAVAGPVLRMLAIAQGLAKGDTNQSITHRSGDEFGQLAEAFRTMIAYMQRMASHATDIADGDLTHNFTPASERDTLGNAFVKMTANLQTLIGEVRQQAGGISGASIALAGAAEESGRATNQIAATMQQLARGATQQADGVTRTASTVEEVKRAIDGVAKGSQVQAASISQTATAMGQLSRTVAEIGQGARAQTAGMQRAAAVREELASALDQMVSAANAVERETQAAATAANGGGAIVAETVAGMQRVRTATEELSERVRDLGRHSAQIGSIVETIGDIAAQTNLLALNAAIEAARAGEHGKGFAVVAEEVRKLAEKSATATKEISEMVHTVQTGATEAVDAMRKAGDDVAAAVRLTDQSGSAFQHITTGAQSAVTRVTSIRQALGAMENASGQLGQVITEVTTIAQKNQVNTDVMTRLNGEVAQSIENVSAVIEQNTAATEQMAASVTEVADAVQTIASVSEENSAAVEEVSASTEEISAQSEEVAASAQSMAELATRLQTSVARFKVIDTEPEPNAAVLVRPAPARVRPNGIAHPAGRYLN